MNKFIHIGVSQSTGPRCPSILLAGDFFYIVGGHYQYRESELYYMVDEELFSHLQTGEQFWLDDLAWEDKEVIRAGVSVAHWEI